MDTPTTRGTARPPLARLGLMMFLQFGAWGAWWVPLGSYLDALGYSNLIATAYATQGIGAIVATMLVGVLADRFVSAQRLLALLSGLGAVVLFTASLVTNAPTLLLGLILVYMLLFMPTLALSATVAMHALSSPKQQFPIIRVFGTIGWIVAGLLVGALAAEQTALPMQLAAGLSAALAVLSLTLRPTPATESNNAPPANLLEHLGLNAAFKAADRSFWAFTVCALLIYIPLSFYYAYTNLFLVQADVPRPAAFQSLGQVSEIAFMLALPFCLRRFGIKWVLLVGMLAWVARYIAFAAGWTFEPATVFLLLGILLHGICYDFFFVAGQIHVDESLPSHMRARAQAFFATVTLGLGTLIGNAVAGFVFARWTYPNGTPDWVMIWFIPAGLAAVTAIVFLATFKPSATDQKEGAVHAT